ncbi:proline/glycine betaine ABC transporter permease [Streptomyces sp. JJ38]|uniref:ABC transporter permease n=1 Tax=Streptomyces sp. JJ38 TaxID=2738128 RepID=UPI001C5873E9|nr:ABC transporter permease subunit [Streptomyces sp. JJ38]MBW1596597.1 ABC transporter permease subunit [Streptomyces sp. JJ38]
MSAPTLEKRDGRPAEPPTDTPVKADDAPERVSVAAWLAARPMALLVTLAAVLVVVSAFVTGSGTWPSDFAIDVRTPLEDLNDWLVENRDSHWLFLYFLLHISNNAELAVDSLAQLFENLGWVGVTVLGTVIAWYAGGAGLRPRALKTAATALGVFVVCGVLGMWGPTMETLALMTVAVALAALLGLLLGVAAGISDRCDRALRPVFDLMQVMPAFAYLLPFVLLFGIGVPSALVATVIYAAPPMARLTSLGMRGANPAALEASASLGASPWQRLWTARLPLARKEMLLGLNQAIMMCLSMVVLASVVGSGGLGDVIYRALGKVNVGQALTAGIAIVLLAVLLDRTTAAAGARLEADEASSGRAARLRGWPSWLGLGALTAVLAAVGPHLGEDTWPREWTYRITPYVNDASDWIEETLGSGVPFFGGTLVWAEGVAEWVLNPLRSGLNATPWWALLVLVAALGWAVGRWRAAIPATASLALIGVLGLWTTSLDTLSQVLLALVLTLVLGFAVGVLAARVPVVERWLRPLLDAMQTMPQFVYLIPVIALFGGGRVAGIAAAVVFVLPAVIRITAQGIQQVDPAAVEAARSMGATSKQQLFQVQLPLARRALLVAVNQGVVLVLSMVVIAAMVGGGGLGIEVIKGLAKADLALGLPAGAAIVCLGVMLDRLTQPARAEGR